MMEKVKEKVIQLKLFICMQFVWEPHKTRAQKAVGSTGSWGGYQQIIFMGGSLTKLEPRKPWEAREAGEATNIEYLCR
jgi:hypothetical protein